MSSPAPPAPRAVHLILGAGGVRCLSHVGALRALRENGFEFASISACSAGTLVAALVCTGMPLDQLEAEIRKLPLHRFSGAVSWNPGRWLFWPFSKYTAPGIPRVFAELAGGDLKLKDLAIPLATTAVDLLTHDTLIYSSESHPEMRVAEVLSIATAAPTLYAPHEREGRWLVDGAIISNCPLWLSRAHGRGGLPTLALVINETTTPLKPRWLAPYVASVMSAAVAARDDQLFESVATLHGIGIRRVTIPSAVRFDDFSLGADQRTAVMNAGYEAMMDDMDDTLRWLKEQPAGGGGEGGAPRAAPPASDGEAAGDLHAARLARQVIFQFFQGVHMGDRIDVRGGGTVVNKPQNSVVNVASRLDGVTQTVTASTALPEEKKTELAGLVEQMKEKLVELEKESPDEAALLASRLEEVAKQVTKAPAERKSSLLKVSADGLLEATKAVGAVVPGLLMIAEKIARFVVVGI